MSHPSTESASLSEGNVSPSLTPLEEVKPLFQPSRGFLLAFASICIVTLAAALDATSLSIALPIITEKLKGTAIEAFWSGTSFLVTSAVFQPVVAGLSHVFGRKEVSLSFSTLVRDLLTLAFQVGSRIHRILRRWFHCGCGSNKLYNDAGGKINSGYWRRWNLDTWRNFSDRSGSSRCSRRCASSPPLLQVFC